MCSGSGPSLSVAVVGGGVAGVAAAQALADAGMPACLYERAESLGGRLGATEFEGQDLVLGMGCSYIKAKDNEFAAQCERWVQSGTLAAWAANPHVINGPGQWASLPDAADEVWYVGVPDMSAIATISDAAAGIEVRRGEELFDANFDAGRWMVATTSASDDESLDMGAEASVASHFHSHLILAVPVDALSNVIDDRKLLDSALGRRRYKDFVKERVSAAFIFEGSLDLPFSFATITADASAVTVAISESSRRSAAGVSQDAEKNQEVWVLQSATGWAKRALDEELDLDVMATKLLESFAAALGRDVKSLPAVLASTASVWPYGDMDYAVPGGCVWREEIRLAMAGDWAFDGRVEGAWRSGRAAAQRVLQTV